jgi:hypothetical protein
VALHAVALLDAETVGRELRGLVEPAPHRLLGDLEQLRRVPGSGLAKGGERQPYPLEPRLNCVVAGVLALHQSGVLIDAVGELTELVRGEAGLEDPPRALRESPLELLVAVHQPLQPIEV